MLFEFSRTATPPRGYISTNGGCEIHPRAAKPAFPVHLVPLRNSSTNWSPNGEEKRHESIFLNNVSPVTKKLELVVSTNSAEVFARLLACIRCRLC